jgi:hypothetical protein
MRITTRVQVVEGRERGVFAGEGVLAEGETAFCRYPHNSVIIDIAAPGYRSERIQVPADPDPAERVIRVELHPGIAWRAQLGPSPRWMRAAAVSPEIILVRTPERLFLVRSATGEIVTALGRGQLPVPPSPTADSALWTDALDPRGETMVVGTTDGLAMELGIATQGLVQGTLLHRGSSPVLAFRDKDLTFQAKRGSYIVTAVEQGLRLTARTPDRDLWSVGGLIGFQRPHLWFEEDRVLLLDDRQLQAFDEVDGRVVARRPLPGARTGEPLRLPDSHLLLIPTAENAVLLKVVVAGDGAGITEVDDAALTEAGGRMLAQQGSAILALRDDKSLRLLNWQGGRFAKQWMATLPADAGAPTWLALTPEAALVGDAHGTVHMLSRSDGSLLRRLIHRSPLLCPPLLVGGRVLIGDREGNLSAYHLPPLPPAK